MGRAGRSPPPSQREGWHSPTAPMGGGWKPLPAGRRPDPQPYPLLRRPTGDREGQTLSLATQTNRGRVAKHKGGGHKARDGGDAVNPPYPMGPNGTQWEWDRVAGLCPCHPLLSIGQTNGVGLGQQGIRGWALHIFLPYPLPVSNPPNGGRGKTKPGKGESAACVNRRSNKYLPLQAEGQSYRSA